MRQKCCLTERINDKINKMLKRKSIKKIRALAEKYRLKIIILFGGLSNKIYDKKSDIDLAILPENNDFYENKSFSDLIFDMCQIEDLEKRDTDIVPITSENPLLLYNIIKNGKPIYLRSEEDYIKLISWARFIYEDNLRFIKR